MKISIVMSTYNGEKYILEQLESIRNQTLAPDEVLVFDDCSTDNTYELVAGYIKEFNLDNWKLSRNPCNYGWRKSFVSAIGKATGDVIFTADQDDIWCKDKIEVMSKEFEKNSDILVLVSDYQEFRYNEMPSKKKKNDTFKLSKISCDSKWYYIRRPGCVFAFRSSIISAMKSIWYEDYAHDALVWHLGVLLGGLYHIDFTSIFFRRHDTNSTPINYHNRTTRLSHTLWAINESDRLKTYFTETGNNELAVNSISEYLIFSKHRFNLLKNRKIVEIPWLFNHIKYYISPKSIFVDACCAMMTK